MFRTVTFSKPSLVNLISKDANLGPVSSINFVGQIIKNVLKRSYMYDIILCFIKIVLLHLQWPQWPQNTTCLITCKLITDVQGSTHKMSTNLKTKKENWTVEKVAVLLEEVAVSLGDGTYTSRHG